MFNLTFHQSDITLINRNLHCPKNVCMQLEIDKQELHIGC